MEDFFQDHFLEIIASTDCHPQPSSLVSRPQRSCYNFHNYSIKCMFYFEVVKREYYHLVGVNFFFCTMDCLHVLDSRHT